MFKVLKPPCYFAVLAEIGKRTIKAGNTNSVQTNVKTIAMLSNIPILAVPGWLDNAIVLKDPIVVNALNITAYGVLVCKTSADLFCSLSRRTR
jgi:hypothetical protein